MSWASTTVAYGALRDRMGVNSTQLGDAAAAAALSAALDRISGLYPTVSSTTYASQTEKRISLGTTVTMRQVLGLEVPVDEDPRQFQQWYYEEDGVVRMPNYEPSTETVRVWYAGTWTITTLPTPFNEDCLTAAVTHGLPREQIESMISWSLGNDANWGNALSTMIAAAKADWKRRVPEIQAQGSNRMIQFSFGRIGGRLI